MYTTKYYLADADDRDNWTEVTKEEYVRAERAAGFRNTLGRPEEPATAGFSSTNYHKVGKVRYITEGNNA
jgi:hypothetical protein